MQMSPMSSDYKNILMSKSTKMVGKRNNKMGLKEQSSPDLARDQRIRQKICPGRWNLTDQKNSPGGCQRHVRSWNGLRHE